MAGCREPGRVGELVDWVCETTDDYGMTTPLSKYLISQGQLTFEDAEYEPISAPEESCDWTQLIGETNSLGWNCGFLYCYRNSYQESKTQLSYC